MEARPGVRVRSYRSVVDEVERRIFRIDRWRIPYPHGISVRGLGYAVGALVAMLIASAVPLLGDAVRLLPASLRLGVLPVLLGWGLASWRIDGRAAHRTLASLARYRLSARTLAGLRPAPAVGAALAPVAAIQIAPAGDEPGYRAGRVRGPARLVLRYPAELTLEPPGALARVGVVGRLPHARLRVRGVGGRPLAVGRELRVGEGGEVVFE